MSDFDLTGLEATATVDEINALAQRLIDEYRAADSVYKFRSARTLDTTVPPY
jgi:hypothetical protein